MQMNAYSVGQIPKYLLQELQLQKVAGCVASWSVLNVYCD